MNLGTRPWHRFFFFFFWHVARGLRAYALNTALFLAQNSSNAMIISEFPRLQGSEVRRPPHTPAVSRDTVSTGAKTLNTSLRTSLAEHSRQSYCGYMQAPEKEVSSWISPVPVNRTESPPEEPHIHSSSVIIIIITINPLTARVHGAPQMILQPVSSIFPCPLLPNSKILLYQFQTPVTKSQVLI